MGRAADPAARLGLVAAVVALALALAACGDSDSDDSTVATSPGPTGATGATGEPSQQGDRGGAKPAPGTSTGGSGSENSATRISFVDTSKPFGVKSAVVYFIAKQPERALPEAKACVREALSRAPSAYCFAFSSARAFRYSRISRKPPARMGRPCWTAYWGKPDGRRTIGAETNPGAESLHCPA
jgi:hypothetical protein